MESGVAVVEGKEPIDGELSTKVIILPRKHLFTHTSTNLSLEIQNRSETEVTTLSALVVLGVLDATTAAESVHTRKDIFVEMESLLCLGHTAAGVHVEGVQEIRMAIM